jgi:ABC-2 type transport system permease protein
MSSLLAMQAGRRLLASTWLSYLQFLSVELIYRYALLHVFVMSGVSLVGMLFFWTAAGENVAADAAYSAPLLVAYFIVVALLGIVQENRLSWNLSAAIRMGKLSAAMLRPFPYLFSVIAQAAAQVTVRAVLLVPMALLLFVSIDTLRNVASQWEASQLWAFAAAVALSLVIGWLTRICLGLLAFDMTQTWGPELIFLACWSVGSGASYPLDLLSPALYTFLSWTPVYYMIGFPTLILLGKIPVGEWGELFVRGGVVTLCLALLVTAMWRRGVKRFEAVGI